MKGEENLRSDARATIEFAILDGIVNVFHVNDDAAMVRSIRDSLFSPETRWAVIEYIKELESEG